jgi:hypothetical protein
MVVSRGSSIILFKLNCQINIILNNSVRMFTSIFVHFCVQFPSAEASPSARTHVC